MVNTITQPVVKWLAPSPLWARPGLFRLDHSNGAIGQPAILRFANDQFMNDLLELVVSSPDQLDEFIAQNETWREPMPKSNAASMLRLTKPDKRTRLITVQGRDKKRSLAPFTSLSKHVSTPLKLFQPVHQRHYLVTASLVYEQSGHPDRFVDSGKREQINFVIRRIVGSDPMDPGRKEYAFVSDEDGYAWKYVPSDKSEMVEWGEELLPLFAITYRPCATDRQILAGTIPVGKREAYLAAGGEDDSTVTVGATEAGPVQRTRMLFETEVIAPWKISLDSVSVFEEAFFQPMEQPSEEKDKQKQIRDFQSSFNATFEQIQTTSWYILLDFAMFLDRYLNSVWRYINGERGINLRDTEVTLIDYIKNTKLQSNLKTTLKNKYSKYHYTVKPDLVSALVTVMQWKDQLERVETSLDLSIAATSTRHEWPNFLFPLVYPTVYIKVTDINDTSVNEYRKDRRLFGVLPTGSKDSLSYGGFYLQHDAKIIRIENLADIVEAALDEDMDGGPELEPVKKFRDSENAWFIIRCVYERPRCQFANKEIVSEPSRPFQMAAFFDPDAPARPVRVPMPLDISPAGLRKYKKNTTFMISDMLCGQLERIRKLTLADLVLSVLPWPFHKDLPNIGAAGSCKKNGVNFGMFCSLSIPIVTLCALVLMIIMVSLFNVFFKWIPFLFLCLPIPGLNGKKT